MVMAATKPLNTAGTISYKKSVRCKTKYKGKCKSLTSKMVSKSSGNKNGIIGAQHQTGV
jgi:hypothetical protein